MAEGKKSFIAYSNWKAVFDELPDEDAGKLIKHIFAYVNDEDPKTDSILIKAVFANIKTTLKRDLEKWESQIQQRREAGKRSAEQRKATKIQRDLTTVERKATSVDSRVRNSTVNVIVNDNVNDKENDIYISQGHLSITWDDMNKLIDKFGEEKSDDVVRRVLNYRKNTKYKSLYLTALNWLNKEQKELEERKTKKPKLAI